MIQTQTIDITYVKQVLDKCPNYDYIVSYNPDDGDVLSQKLIDWYKELIFSVNRNSTNQLSIISMLDKSLYLYIKDHKYNRGLKKILTEDEITLKNQDSIKEVIIKIIKYTNNYDQQRVLEINNSVWL